MKVWQTQTRRAASTLRVRFFSSPADAPRSRRPTDALLLAASAVALAMLAAIGSRPLRLGDAVSAFVRALPGLLGWFWELSRVAVGLWAIALLVVFSVAPGRRAVLRDQVLAMAVAAAGARMTIEGAFSSGIGDVEGLALAIAAISTTAPHLGRPFRRVGRWLTVLGPVSLVVLGAGTIVGVAEAAAVGLGAAALVRLVFGSPGGRPTPQDVARALGGLDIEVAEIREAALGWHGVATMQATDADGRPLLVKVYGRDARDGQLINVTWSYLWYRDTSATYTLNRLQQVEHEAFVTLLAERGGVPVQPVVAAGMADQDALLVVRDPGRWLVEVRDEPVTDAFLVELWRSVDRLHGLGIAHGALDERHIAIVEDGSGVLGGFGGAVAAASPAQFGSDRAQLLVTSALRVGSERAIAAAVEAIGPEGLADILPYVQDAALTRPIRQALRGRTDMLASLREELASAAGTQIPKLEPLRRVTWGSVALLAVLGLGAWALISAISDVGLQTIVDELGAAQDQWLWAALLLSPSVQVAEAVSTMGACPVPLRLGPVLLLQYAIRFMAVAVPSSAARIALNVRFFQRAGVATSPAIAVGVVDSVAGFVVQVVLLLLIWLTGIATFTLPTSGLSLSLDPRLVAGAVIAVVVAISIAVTLPKVRRAIRPRLAEASEALRTLWAPSKLLQLFLGNLGAQVLLAAVLGLCLRAFGEHASLAQLIVVNTLASLLAGLLPIPGGIGVMEAAISAGLAASGVPEAAAVSTALIFRVVTFYLPPVWGSFAMRALRAREYV